MALDGYQDIKTGDVLECFSLEEVKPTLQVDGYAERSEPRSQPPGLFRAASPETAQDSPSFGRFGTVVRSSANRRDLSNDHHG